MSPKDLIPNQSKVELYEFIRTVLTGVVTTCVVYGVAMIQDVSNLAKAHELIIKQDQEKITDIHKKFQDHITTDEITHKEHDKRIRVLEYKTGINP